MTRTTHTPAPTGARLQLLLLCAALLALLVPSPVYSHGSLTVPRSRNVISPIRGETWWKDHGNGHGSAVVKPLNGPGVCGDPYQHWGDTTFYQRSPGTIQANYAAGQTINVQWHIQVNHGGRIGVKLCNRRDNIDQACFNQFPLQRADGLGPFVYIMSGASMGTLGTMSANFRLPAGVSCSGGCVLQWEYLTMNSCFEPCDRRACGVYADRVNPVTGQRNMGTCCLGSSCSAANVPEVFRNCADISIGSSGGGGTPPGPTPPTGGCTRTAAPGGSCGGGTCCPSGQCCSQWGWCGITSSHCGTGCQRSWGACWSSARRSNRRAGPAAANATETATASTEPATAGAAAAAAAAVAPGATEVPVASVVAAAAADIPAPTPAVEITAAATDVVTDTVTPSPSPDVAVPDTVTPSPSPDVAVTTTEPATPDATTTVDAAAAATSVAVDASATVDAAASAGEAPAATATP